MSIDVVSNRKHVRSPEHFIGVRGGYFIPRPYVSFKEGFTMRKYVRNFGQIGVSSYQVRHHFVKGKLPMEKAMSLFLSHKDAEGLNESTMQMYREHFRYLLYYFNPEISVSDLTSDAVLGYVRWMKDEKRLSPVTINIRIRTLRTFLRWLEREGYLSEPLHERLTKIREPDTEIDVLTPREIRKLLSVIDTNRYVGFRDYVMICILLDTMVRISELLKMKRSNVRGGSIRLDAQDTKVKRGRTVPVSDKTEKLLLEYIAETNDFGRNELFLNYDGTPVKANTWRKRLQEYARNAGLEHKRIRPHLFRHTGAVLYLLNGVDPFSLR
nr:integrase [Bacillota bacterium]